MMHDEHVCDVHQVVNHVPIVGLDLQVAGHWPINLRSLKEWKPRQEFRRRHVRIAHPDPNQSVAFLNRIAPYHGRDRRKSVTIWVEHAFPRGIEPQPVVSALDGIFYQLAEVQRRKAMRTYVGERKGTTGAIAVK